MPLALVVASPYVLVVTPSLLVQSVPELIKLARDKPRQLAFASAGAGTPHHLFPHLFQTKTGIEMTHIPYRGSVPALTDVAAGHVQLMFSDVPPALSLINEGRVRAIGVSTKERVAALPHLVPIVRCRLRRGIVADGGRARRHAEGHRSAPARGDQRVHGAA